MCRLRRSGPASYHRQRPQTASRTPSPRSRIDSARRCGSHTGRASPRSRASKLCSSTGPCRTPCTPMRGSHPPGHHHRLQAGQPPRTHRARSAPAAHVYPRQAGHGHLVAELQGVAGHQLPTPEVQLGPKWFIRRDHLEAHHAQPSAPGRSALYHGRDRNITAPKRCQQRECGTFGSQ